MKKEKRSTVRLSEEAVRKLQRVQGDLLSKHGVRRTQDDVIDHLAVEMDTKEVTAAMALAAEART